MLALIAGEGRLPGLLLERLDGREVRLCALAGFPPEVPADRRVETFRLEHLGSLLRQLREEGITEVCMAGRVRRPEIDPAKVDAETRPLAERIGAALRQGDDGTLREILALFEEQGLRIVAVPEIAPDLLPPAGVLTQRAPEERHATEAALGEATVAEMGASDTGQACVLREEEVVAREGPEGTDAMLAELDPEPAGRDQINRPLEVAAEAMAALLSAWTPGGGTLFKAPKPGQDRRVDLPTIGPETAMAAARAGLDGITVEQGGTLVIDRDRLVELCDRLSLFLWVRPHGDAG